MEQLQRTYARRLVGKRVRVARVTGGRVEGRLMSFNGRTLWIVNGDDDTFVPLRDIVGLAPGAM